MPIDSQRETILVPLDGSELATASIRFALALAERGADVALVRVLPEPIPMMELAGTAAYPVARIRKKSLEQAQNYLDSVVAAIADANLNVSTHVLDGDPPQAIVKAATDLGATLIVMSTHGRGFLGRVLIGSVADHVARHSPIPVLLVPHSATDEIGNSMDGEDLVQRIVVPLDGSELARRALPVAARYAQLMDIPVQLIRVSPFVPETEASEAIHDAHQFELLRADKVSLQAEALRLSTTGLEVSVCVAVGAPADRILEHVSEDDIVVMTSHGQGGIRRRMIGSVAETLIHANLVPILLVPAQDHSLPDEQTPSSQIRP